MNGLAIGINPEASDVGQGVAASRPIVDCSLRGRLRRCPSPMGTPGRVAFPATQRRRRGPVNAVSAVDRHRMLTQEDKSARTGKSYAWHRPGSDRCICHASIPA